MSNAHNSLTTTIATRLGITDTQISNLGNTLVWAPKAGNLIKLAILLGADQSKRSTKAQIRRGYAEWALTDEAGKSIGHIDSDCGEYRMVLTREFMGS